MQSLYAIFICNFKNALRDAFTLTTACAIPCPMRTSSAEGRRANTAAETAAELAAFDHGLRIYTDGGCDSNGAGGVLGASGWGAHALQVGLDGDCLTTIAVADLWGPVETARTSRWWMGATRNTGHQQHRRAVWHWPSSDVAARCRTHGCRRRPALRLHVRRQSGTRT